MKGLAVIRDIAARNSKRVFLIDSVSGQEYTYAQFLARAETIAAYLTSLGLRAQDRIAIVMDNSVSCCELYFGAMLARVVVVPINPILSASQIAHVIADSRAKRLFVSKKYEQSEFAIQARIETLCADDVFPGLEQKAFAAEGGSDADELIIIYTSGTTADPKGIVHGLDTLIANARMYTGAVGIRAESRFINYLPITYLGGYYNLLLLPFVAEGSTVLSAAFNAQAALRFWEPIKKYQVNTLWLVPTIINILLETDRGTEGIDYCKNNLRTALVGTAPLLPAPRKKFEERYGVKLLQNFALSETLFLTSELPSGSGDGCGGLLPGIELRLCNRDGNDVPLGEEGEIVVKTPYLMQGYYDSASGKAARTSAEEWFATGDVGAWTSDRTLQITGRQKDLIIRGGINISPAAIEQVLVDHSGVSECAIVGIPERIMGEEIIAVIRPVPGSDFEQTKTELKELARTKLASIHQPSVYLELGELPKTASGKVQKAKIRSWAQDRVSQDRQSKARPVKNTEYFFQPSKVVGESSEAMSIKYNTMVYEKKQRNEDVIVLSLGEAFFDIPLYSFDDLPFPAIYHYSHSRGIPELRECLSKYFLQQYDVAFDPANEIIITAGSKIAIYMALMTVVNPGDEVLIHEPAWVSYPEQVKYCHGVPVQIPYDVEVADFERYITNRTKMIIINNPNNPRGKIYSLDELTHLYKLCQKYNLFLLSDEAYSDFVLEKDSFVSVGNLDREKKHLILVNSISKNYGISGWRLGYVISNPNFINQLLKVNQHLVTCPATILEYYIAKHFFDIIRITKPQIQEVVRKRQEIAEYMDGLGLKYLPGTSTFYFFVSIDGSRLSSEEFCTKLLQERGVSVVPGIGYGPSCDKFVRISVGTESMERMQKGISEVKRLIDETSDAPALEVVAPGILDAAKKGCEILVRTCAQVQAGERALIISDYSTKDLGELLASAARHATNSVTHRSIAPFTIHGQEPPSEVVAEMMRAHVIFGISKMSMAHTKARVNAMNAGARYLSLPDYSLAVLASRALLADFHQLTDRVSQLTDALSAAQTLVLSGPSGTNLSCLIQGRKGNAAPGWCAPNGRLASPPDVEANIAPVEGSATGIIVVDGSIPCPELGKLAEPIKLFVEKGRVVQIEGEQSERLTAIFDRVGNDRARMVAEIGIGLNPEAELVGRMLEDEGCYGTAHVGIGSNATIGGANDVPFHLDMVIRSATIKLDGKAVLENGDVVLK